MEEKKTKEIERELDKIARDIKYGEVDMKFTISRGKIVKVEVKESKRVVLF